MPKNKGAGGKNRRRGKGDVNLENRELVFKENDQDYAIVNKMLGGTNVRVTLSDSTTVVAHIRGSFKKKIWIVPGDLVLVGLRDYQEGKVDIIYKYTVDEQKMLKSYGEIGDSFIKQSSKEYENIEGADEVAFEIDDI